MKANQNTPMSIRNLHQWQSALFGGALFAALSYATPAVADDFISETVTNNTGSSQSQFNIVLAGNVAGDVDATLNPFGSSGSLTTWYSSSQNWTILSFTGTAIANNSLITAGLSDTVSDQIIGNYWGAVDAPNPQAPAPTISLNLTGSGGSTMYLIVYVPVTLQFGGPLPGSKIWYEQPVTSGQTAQIELANNDITNETLAVLDAGYLISPTQIPLDDLNLNNYPPTSFTTAILGADINPGGDVLSGTISVPEPAAALVLAPGILGLWVCRRLRRK
jgi:hypothetical protein